MGSKGPRVSDFGAVLAGLPKVRICRGPVADPVLLAEVPGLQVSPVFAVTAGVEDDERAGRWALTHLPSGGSVGWARDGEILVWLALRLEAIDETGCLASPQPWVDHPREYALVTAERMRLFGTNLVLDGGP